MTWKSLVIISILSGIVIALLNCIPILKNTSLTAPAETPELWILLAVYIIMHCKGYRDAMLKTFVFFLISQPLIYLIEVPFNELGWGIFRYYRYWGIVTILTIPGAALAYRVKKGDVFSGIILSVANVLMLLCGINWTNGLICEFPRHLLSVIFCLAVPFLMIFFTLKEKKSRLVSVIITSLALIACIGKIIFFPGEGECTYPVDEGNWRVESVSEDGLSVELNEDYMIIKSHRLGKYELVLSNEAGETRRYEVTVEGMNLLVNVEEVPK